MGVVYLTANQTIASRAVFQLSLTNPTMSIARTPGFSLFFSAFGAIAGIGVDAARGKSVVDFPAL